MTLLVNKNIGGTSGPVIRNYSVLSGDSANLAANLTNAQYMKGSIFINDGTHSLFFNYSITNFNQLNSVIYGMIGKEFSFTITDFTSGSITGFTLINHELSTLTITLIQEI